MNVTMQPVDAINSVNRHRFSFRNHWLWTLAM